MKKLKLEEVKVAYNGKQWPIERIQGDTVYLAHSDWGFVGVDKEYARKNAIRIKFCNPSVFNIKK